MLEACTCHLTPVNCLHQRPRVVSSPFGGKARLLWSLGWLWVSIKLMLGSCKKEAFKMREHLAP